MNYDLILVDGDNVAFKNHYANIRLSFQKRLSGALFGTLQSLISMRKNFGNRIIFTWSDNNKYRKDLYPEYKASRKKEGLEPFYLQLKLIHEILSCMGISQVKLKDREADDAIANISYDLSTYKILIISQDKDLLQLVNHNVHQYRSEKIIDVPKFIEEFGFSPRFIPLYLSIVGDNSDNITGVPSIGKKKTEKLIQEFGDDLFRLLSKQDIKYNNDNLSKVLANKDIVLRNLEITDLSKVKTKNPDDNMMEINFNLDRCLDILSGFGLISLINPITKIYDERYEHCNR